MRSKIFLVLVVLLLASWDAMAANVWTNCSTSTSVDPPVLGGVSGQTKRTICLDITAAVSTGITGLRHLDAAQCETVDVFFFPNTTTPFTGTATGYLMSCPSDSATVTTACRKILVDQDGGGVGPSDDLPMSGDDGTTASQRFAIYGASSSYVGFYNVGAISGTPRLLLKCNNPAGAY